MVNRTSLGLAFALTLSAFATGCAGSASDDVRSNEGAATTAAASSLAHAYQGTIGSLKVLVRVQAQGASLTGSYVYADNTSNGDTLLLKGTVSGSRLTMTESVNGAGAATGTFSGAITAAGITGTWKSPTGSSLPLALTPIKDLTLVTRKLHQSVKGGADSQGQDCSLDATLVDVYGVANASAETAINSALKVDLIQRDSSGACDGLDIRSVTQSVTFNQSGFLTVAVATETDGGAHPDNSVEYDNFNLADGSSLTAKDFFIAGAAPQVKALLIKAINADPQLQADDKKAQLDELDNEWADDMDLGSIQFSLGADGLLLDMTDNYPHVVLALAPAEVLPWSDLKPLLAPGTVIAPLVH